MNLRSLFVSDAQSPKLVQPGERALDHPAQGPQPGTMGQASPGQPALDAALGQRLTMRLRVVGTVTEEALREIAGCAALATDGRDRMVILPQVSGGLK